MKLSAPLFCIPAFIAGFLGAVGMAVATAPPLEETPNGALRQVVARLDRMEVGIRTLSGKIEQTPSRADFVEMAEPACLEGPDLAAELDVMRQELRRAVAAVRSESETAIGNDRDAAVARSSENQPAFEESKRLLEQAIASGGWSEQDLLASEYASTKLTRAQRRFMRERLVEALSAGDLEPNEYGSPF